MFASQNTDNESTENDQENTSTDENQFFDERSQIHETYWVACDANRRNGPQIFQNDELTVKGSDDGVSGVVDDYRFFNDQKQELIEEITGEKDMYGLRKYRQDFPEPDPEMWKEGASDHYGINIVGIHEIPADVAQEEFNVDYSQDGIDPIFVPILETEDGEEVVYSPVDFYDSDESQATEPTEAEDEGTESETVDASLDEEPEFPADPDTVQAYLEEQPVSDLNKQQRSTLAKLRDPTKTNRDIAEMDNINCSKNTVRKGLRKFLGESGYEDLKERGKELRSGGSSGSSNDYEEKMMATTDGGSVEEGTDETVEVDAEAFAKLEGRIERLESMFDAEVLERI